MASSTVVIIKLLPRNTKLQDAAGRLPRRTADYSIIPNDLLVSPGIVFEIELFDN